MSIEDIIGALGSKMGTAPCELGKIKLGGLSPQVRTAASGRQWRAPQKFDHFIITTLNRDSAGDLIPDTDLMEQLKTEYGDHDGKLRRIPIRLLSDDIDDVIQSAFVWYGNKSVGARSDGKTVTWFYDPDTGQRYPEPVVQDWGPDLLERKTRNNAPLFKVHSVFNCVIAAKEARWGGVYKFRTTSLISLRQMHASLLHLLQLTGGMVVGMPLQLIVRPIQVSPDGKATTVHVVHIELRGGDLIQLQHDALQMAQFRLTFKEQIQKTQVQYRRLLALPGSETGNEAAEIEAEFSPENPGVQSVPTDKPYGLLDDAPAPPTVADLNQSEPPSQTEDYEPEPPPLEPDIQDEPPSDDGSVVANRFGGVATATIAAPAIPAADMKLVESYPKFLETLNNMAMGAHIAAADLNKWLGVRLVRAGLKGQGEKTTIPWRLAALEEMRHWKLD